MPRPASALLLVSYDISDDRVRAQTAKLLEGFGLRIQYSVFECRLMPRRAADLRGRLRRIRLADRDSIEIVPCCAHCDERRQRLGWGRSEPDRSVV